jgi:hypothetical protein
MKYRAGLGVIIVALAAAVLSSAKGTCNLIHGWVRGRRGGRNP